MGRMPPKFTDFKAERQDKICKGAERILQLVACYITTGISPCMNGMLLGYQNKIKGEALHQYKTTKNIINTGIKDRFLYGFLLLTRRIYFVSFKYCHKAKMSKVSTEKSAGKKSAVL